MGLRLEAPVVLTLQYDVLHWNKLDPFEGIAMRYLNKTSIRKSISFSDGSFIEIPRLNPLKRVKFISMKNVVLERQDNWRFKSQSPQTGQVYFNCLYGNQCLGNWTFCLNPLKRVKFISIVVMDLIIFYYSYGLNPLKRVKFISIGKMLPIANLDTAKVSIPSNGSSLFQ